MNKTLFYYVEIIITYQILGFNDKFGKNRLEFHEKIWYDFYGVPLPLPYRYESGLYQYQILLNKEEEIVFDISILDDPVITN